MLKRLFVGRKNRRQNTEASFTNLGKMGCDLAESPDREEDGFLLVGESAIERSTIRPADHCSSPSYPDSPPSYESQVAELSYTSPQPYKLHVPGDASIAALYHIPQLTTATMGQRTSNQVTTEVSPEYVSVGGIQTLGGAQTGNELFEEVRLDLPMHGPGMYHSPVSTPRGRHKVDDNSSLVSTLPGEILSEEELRAAATTLHQSTYISPIDGVPFRLASWLEFSESNWSSYECLTIPNIDLTSYDYDFSIEKSVVREYQQQALLTGPP